MSIYESQKLQCWSKINRYGAILHSIQNSPIKNTFGGWSLLSWTGQGTRIIFRIVGTFEKMGQMIHQGIPYSLERHGIYQRFLPKGHELGWFKGLNFLQILIWLGMQKTLKNLPISIQLRNNIFVKWESIQFNIDN